jgi:hypothetical protein
LEAILFAIATQTPSANQISGYTKSMINIAFMCSYLPINIYLKYLHANKLDRIPTDPDSNKLYGKYTHLYHADALNRTQTSLKDLKAPTLLVLYNISDKEKRKIANIAKRNDVNLDVIPFDHFGIFPNRETTRTTFEWLEALMRSNKHFESLSSRS